MYDFLKNDNFGKLILRLTVGSLMLFHGVAKISHIGTLEFIKGQLANFSIPSIIAYGVFAGEIVAPIMIIFGIYARLGGLIVVINMVFAVVLVHVNDLFSLSEHGGWRLELQAFYLFCGLAVLFLGSGRFAFKPD